MPPGRARRTPSLSLSSLFASARSPPAEKPTTRAHASSRARAQHALRPPRASQAAQRRKGGREGGREGGRATLEGPSLLAVSTGGSTNESW
eukprot:2887173-Rhodomonas_salina.1